MLLGFLLGLQVVCVDTASIPIESGGSHRYIGKAELLNAKELLRREGLAEKTGSKPEQASGSLVETKSEENSVFVPSDPVLLPEEIESKPGQPKAVGSLAATENKEASEIVPNAHRTLLLREGVPPEETESPEEWKPDPPGIIRIPTEPGPCGGWSFVDDPNLKHGAFAYNRWSPCHHKGGAPHYGVTGTWEFSRGTRAMPALTLKERMRAQRAAQRRNPSTPKFDQTWPPPDGYKMHGHWFWHDANGYRHPDWARPEELSGGNSEYGPGRWRWSWQRQLERWDPMPPTEYDKWKDHIERISPDRTVYEMSKNPICASCAGGCATASACEYQGEGGLSLEEYCKEAGGHLCAEAAPGMQPHEAHWGGGNAHPPHYPAGPAGSHTNVGEGSWDDMTWVPSHHASHGISGHSLGQTISDIDASLAS